MKTSSHQFTFAVAMPCAQRHAQRNAQKSPLTNTQITPERLTFRNVKHIAQLCLLSLVTVLFIASMPVASADPTSLLTSSGMPSHQSLRTNSGGKAYIGDAQLAQQLVNKNITVEAWVKPNAFASWGGVIGAFQDNGSFERGWVLGTSWSNQFSFGLASNSTHKLTYLRSNSDTCERFTTGRWHHVAGVYDGHTMSLYVNGILCNQSTSQQGNIAYPEHAEFVIGAYVDDNEHNHFDGEIQEVRLWNTALSKQQIRENIAYHVTPNDDYLVGYWLATEENTLASIFDLSSQSNHAVLMNALPTPSELKLEEKIAPTPPKSPQGWHTQGSQIIQPNGQPVVIKAMNWFGFQTETYLVHGLWEVNYREHLSLIKSLGFNTIRLPFANTTLLETSFVDGYIDPSNDDFVDGETPALDALDQFIEAAGEAGLWIILDRHSQIADVEDPDVWFSQDITEQQWIQDWQFLAQRYLNNPTVIGADLSNEPKGTATWGTGFPQTDWRRAAIKAGNAVLDINPNWLIVVEGIDWSDHFFETESSNEGGIVYYPVALHTMNKVVYSPHEYGPDDSGYKHRWFKKSTTYHDAKAAWDRTWGYIIDQQIAPVLVGEFGGRYVDPTATALLADYPSNENLTQGDAARWMQFMVQYLAEKNASYAYWTWTPNSTNTGGILDDSYQVIGAKINILAPIL